MTSTVYFVPITESDTTEIIQDKVGRLCDRAGLAEIVEEKDLVALKVHFGEEGNHNYVPAEYLAPLVTRVKRRGGKPFWTDTNTLYHGKRSNAVDHILLAHKHGFSIEKTGIPVIIADGLSGRSEERVRVEGVHSPQVGVASAALEADALIVISHATGHLVSGYGGAIKNLGMGLSARKGKLYQHSTVRPWVNRKLCKGDGACVKWCPEHAIQLLDRKAVLDSARCVGCGEYLAVCRHGAIQFAWKMDSPGLQERMVEQALGVIRGRKGKVAYLTFLLNVGKDCDCLRSDPADIIAHRVGIVAGMDIVATEKATIDLLEQAMGRSLREAAYDIDYSVQIRHAIRMGMGSEEYQLVQL